MDEVRQVLFGLNGFEVIGAEVDDLNGELMCGWSRPFRVGDARSAESSAG